MTWAFVGGLKLIMHRPRETITIDLFFSSRERQFTAIELDDKSLGIISLFRLHKAGTCVTIDER